MKFAVVVSTRGRPDGANAVLGAARLLASTKHEIRYIVAYDDDDETCLSYPFAAYVEKSVGPRPIGPGACWNRAFATSKMDVLVGFADDNLVVTPHWDDVIARHLEAVDPRIGVLSWHNNASPNQPTLMVAHREWIDRAGFFDGRFPFWFADTAIAETYSFVTGQLLPMPEALWVLGKYGESNPRLRDMRLWWAFYSATRRERLQTAARIREELGLPAPANLDQLVAAWQARDAEGLPLSEEIARGLPPREPDGHYLIARDAARYYLTSGQRICLSMIVKNEARVIRRCLDSVMPLIDCWSIVDTGSTDGTQAIIREHMRFLPGSLHERPWKDFAANRSEALELARAKADFTLIVDADDMLEIPPGFVMPALAADCYLFDIRHGHLAYTRPQLVRNTLPWRYEGILHEFLTCPGSGSQGRLALTVRCGNDGARRTNPEALLKDAALLETARETESDPAMRARYQFYLAQSYRDSGQWAKALEAYLRRAEMGFWIEEVFVSLYQAGLLSEHLEHDTADVIALYTRASEAVPTRAEALHGAARLCRNLARYEEGFQFAQKGVAIGLPADGLFVEPWIYEYGLLDELAVNAYGTARYATCAHVCEQLLREGKLPPEQQDRVRKNRQFALDAQKREHKGRQ